VITGVPANVLDANDFSVVHGSSAWGINDKRELAGTYVQSIPCATCGPHGEPSFTVEVHSFVATPQHGPARAEAESAGGRGARAGAIGG
jgi:hypothetical protein